MYEQIYIWKNKTKRLPIVYGAFFNLPHNSYRLYAYVFDEFCVMIFVESDLIVIQ